MVKREFAQYLFAFWGQGEKNFAPIIIRAAANNIPSGLKAVHKFDRAVMANLHSIRQFADARTHIRRHPFNRKHQLILAAFQASPLYYLFAEVEKAANLVAELRQGLVVRQSELLHAAIVSCRDP